MGSEHTGLHKIKRRKSREVAIGKVIIGGKNPIAVQTMTKVDTTNLPVLIDQMERIVHAGCDIIRIAVKNKTAAKSISALKKKFDIPIIADIHFDPLAALAAIEHGADKIRINPGNISKIEDLTAILKAAKNRGVAVRMGINSGSIPKKFVVANKLTVTDKFAADNKLAGGSTGNRSKVGDPLVASALYYAAIAEKLKFKNLVLSVKSSSVLHSISAYEAVAKTTDYPLHLGITEAGPLVPGTVKSSVGLGILLYKGIGDTIRVSLTEDPVQEVKVGFNILAALGLREQTDLVSCPTCGRCEVDIIDLAHKVETYLDNVKTPIKVAVMGCVVNGPGEAKDADIGVACGNGQGILFKKGLPLRKVKEKDLFKELTKEIDSLS